MVDTLRAYHMSDIQRFVRHSKAKKVGGRLEKEWVLDRSDEESIAALREIRETVRLLLGRG